MDLFAFTLKVFVFTLMYLIPVLVLLKYKTTDSDESGGTCCKNVKFFVCSTLVEQVLWVSVQLERVSNWLSLDRGNKCLIRGS